MRTNPILIVTALALASTGAAYYLLRGNAVPRHVEAVKPPSSSAASLTVKNVRLRDERRDHPVDPEQRRLTLMHEKIADLEARLRYMEATASEQAKDQAGSGPDKPVANERTEKAKAKKLLEEDFGHWLDEALITGDFDREATRLTMDEMETSLAEAPDINLADLQCGQRFCRASFVPDNGTRPNISQLIGASPFIESGFTLNEPDGGVRVYFTQPGQSFGELRREAQESVLRDMYPQ
ncbi:MAG: hypothetical protein AB7P69_21950 [Candidatus Binatia bacterium]